MGYYSTSTGNTETVAGYISSAAGLASFDDIGDATDDEIKGAEGLIVGAPTWHTGADEQRSGTGWGTIRLIHRRRCQSLRYDQPRWIRSRRIQGRMTTNSADLCATKTTNTICPKTVPRHGLPNLRMKDSSKYVQFQAESITTGYHFFLDLTR